MACSKCAIAIWTTIILAIVAVAITLTVLFIRKDVDIEPFLGRAGVAANGLECAGIGGDILRQNGSAVDAAIATLLCEGVAAPHSMGLGGGFLMVIYSKATGRVETLTAREMAPLAATEEMFVNNTAASSKGGLSVAVPGELKGYYEAHKRYGKLPWRNLLEPTIKLCKEGHTVSRTFASTLANREESIYKEPSLREIFIDPKTNRTYKEGDKIKRLKLAESLEIMAREGSDALYSRTGSLIKGFVQDIQSFNGIITEEDMIGYQVEWGAPEITKLLDNMTLYTQPLPGTGSILSFMLNIISGYELKDNDPLTIHRVIESFKYGYARRSYLGDRKFVPGIEELLSNLTNPEYASYIRSMITDNQTYNTYEHYGANFSNVEDHGTGHVSVLHENGDAVAATSTINLILGAGIRSMSTGIILNDEMDDFSTPGTINEFGVPASPANYIVPKKRPLSSMVPTIIVDKYGNPRLIVGAAGGTKITTSVTQIILNNLYFAHSLEESVNAARVHHQLAPMRVEHEHDYDIEIINELKTKQHTTRNSTDSGFAAVVAVARDMNGKISAMFDPRRGGSVAILE